MQTNGAQQFLPAASSEKMVEVSLDGDQAVIRLSTWTDGLGWSSQKTISLDENLLDEMSRLLMAARARLKAERASQEQTNAAETKVLKFPSLK